MTIIDHILQFFAEKGQQAYFGEAVTETEHALQTAYQAEEASASDSVIAAALLHDVGHLLHGLPEDIAVRGIDGRHEEAVADPVRLHVAAKRYLCAVDPAYQAALSPASQLSLRLQGGPFSPDEVRRFEQEPFGQAAVCLRRWDDAAKVEGLVVPGLEHYRPCLQAVLLHTEDA
jgi:predicted HD phosphohydrolase